MRHDDRGILDAGRLRRRVRLRRCPPAPELRRYVAHYWLIDWDLDEPFEQSVVPHPSVNVVFRRVAGEAGSGEVAGIQPGLFTTALSGAGAISGIMLRAGGHRPFWDRPATGLRLPADAGGPVWAGGDDERCAVLDAYLLGLGPRPDPAADRAVALVDAVRDDPALVRVADLARRHDMTVRGVQRLFRDQVGVSPKWVLLRYRLHEAIGRAADGPPDWAGPDWAGPDWAGLACELGYSDQAHLIRDFTATLGVTPAAYARSLRGTPDRTGRGPAGNSG